MGRKNKSIYIILIIVLLICVTIGYAVINTTLNINGKSSVSKNTWNIYFDNIQIKNGSTGEVKTPTISDQTTIDFEVALNLPGDFYEFSVDVVNNGTIDAMIENITKEPELTEAQQKYLNYIITYENDEAITTKKLVKKEEFVRLKVRVEYRKDITASDLPTVTETLNLGFNVNYVQSDDSGIIVKNNGVKVVPTANGSLDNIGTIVTIGTEQFYTIETEGDNVKLLSMYNLYVGNECTSSLESSCTQYGEEATGMQESTMLGAYVGLRKGVVGFSSDTKKGINYSDYNGSLVEEYVNNYKTKIENMGVNVVEARLITREELDNLGCSIVNNSCSLSVYSWSYSTRYWTGTASNDSKIWAVGGDYKEIYSILYDNSTAYGVRPVIVISKSVF